MSQTGSYSFPIDLFSNDERKLLQECIHCGLCLPTCPTYVANGMEMDSPRGRLYFMNAALGGRIGLTDSLIKHTDLCLICRACESACPSGVRFGQLIEKTRDLVSPHRKQTRINKWISNTILRRVILSHRTLSVLAGIIWLYQRAGIQWLTINTLIKYLFPKKIRALQNTLPQIPLKRFGKNKTQIFPATGEKQGRVSLFTGCVMDHLFPDIHVSTIRILNWNGFEVVIPKEQTCCGAIHSHSGDLEMTKQLALKNISAFNDNTFDAIIVNAAGCSAQLKDYHHIFPNDPEVERFIKKVRDVTEFLSEIDFRIPESPLNQKVVYDEPCHLIHAQGITKEPKKLIDNLPGITLLPLMESDHCCGNAGIYTVTQTEMSIEILDRKVNFIKQSGADLIITANPGCQIQLDWGIRRQNLSMNVLHIVELIDSMYQNEPNYPTTINL